MDRRKIDIVLSAVLMIMALIILTSDNFVEGGAESDIGNMFLPRVVATLIILFAGSIGIQSLLKLIRRATIEEPELIITNGFAGIVIYIGIFVAYWLAVPYVGFLIATPIVMFAIAQLLGGRSWLPITLMSVILPLIIFFGSREFLRVYLPTWTLS